MNIINKINLFLNEKFEVDKLLVKKAKILFSKKRRIKEKYLKYEGSEDYSALNMGIGIYLTIMDPSHEKFKSTTVVMYKDGKFGKITKN